MYGKMYFIFKAVILHPIKAIIKIDEELRQARMQQHKELEHKPTASVEKPESEEDRSFKGKDSMEALYGNFIGSVPKIEINGARLSEMNQRNAILLHTILDQGNEKYNKKQEETQKKIDKQIFVAKPVEEISAAGKSKNGLSQVPLPILEIPPMSTYGSLLVGKELQLGAKRVQEEDAKKLHSADLKEFQNQATQTCAISSQDLEFSADDYDTQNLTSSRSCNNDHTTTSELHNETKLERYTSNIDMPPEPEISYECDEMNPITSAASSYYTCLSSFGEKNLQDPLTTLRNFKTTEKSKDIGKIELASTGQNKDDDKKHEHKDTEQKKSKNSHLYEKYADQFQEDNLNTHKLKDFEQQKRNAQVKPVTENTKLSAATPLPHMDTTDALSKSKSLRLWKMQQLINIFENPSGVVGMDKSFKDTELNTFITKRSSDIKEFIAKFELKEKLNSVKQELSEMFGNEQK